MMGHRRGADYLLFDCRMSFSGAGGQDGGGCSRVFRSCDNLGILS